VPLYDYASHLGKVSFHTFAVESILNSVYVYLSDKFRNSCRLCNSEYPYYYNSRIQIIKTQTTCIPDLTTFVEASHPYDVPEVISVKAS